MHIDIHENIHLSIYKEKIYLYIYYTTLVRSWSTPFSFGVPFRQDKAFPESPGEDIEEKEPAAWDALDQHEEQEEGQHEEQEEGRHEEQEEEQHDKEEERQDGEEEKKQHDELQEVRSGIRSRMRRGSGIARNGRWSFARNHHQRSSNPKRCRDHRMVVERKMRKRKMRKRKMRKRKMRKRKMREIRRMERRVGWEDGNSHHRHRSLLEGRARWRRWWRDHSNRRSHRRHRSQTRPWQRSHHDLRKCQRWWQSQRWCHHHQKGREKRKRKKKR